MSIWIPQALADPVSRSVLFVWHDEGTFRLYWQDKVETVDAPGVSVHPRLVRAGDVVDLFITGWNRGRVRAVEFLPDAEDIPDWHRCGCFRFDVEGTGFVNIRVDGRVVRGGPLYRF